MTAKPVLKSGPAERPSPVSGKDTLPQVRGESAPRLPHERDESADSQKSEPRQRIIQAKRDIENGLVDTDIGPVLDDVYEREMRATGDASGTDRVTPDGIGEDLPGLLPPGRRRQRP